MKRNLLITAGLLVCQTTSAVDLQAAVNEVCSCYEEPYKIIAQSLDELAGARASGDYSALADAQGKVMAVMDSSANCFESLPEKYPEIDANTELQNKVIKMSEEQCPNPASRLKVLNR